MDALLTSLLEKYLGAYVENLNSLKTEGNTLKCSLLRLRSEAFRRFSLPLDLTEGVIESLIIIRPDIFSLGKEPIVAELDGLYIVASPDNLALLSPKEVEERILITKRKLLELSTLFLESDLAAPATGGAEAGWLDRLQRNILHNLQLTIRNIHIRLEVPEKPYAFSAGVSLREATLFTTGSTWERGFVELKERGYKRGALEHLALYLNPHGSRYTPLAWRNQEHFCALMRHLIAEPAPQLQHDFLLLPCFFGVHISFDILKESKRDWPKHKPRVRPDSDEHAREWWGYLAHRMLLEKRTKGQVLTSAALRAHRADRDLYVDHFLRKHATSKTASSVPAIDRIETEHSLDALLFFRRMALTMTAVQTAERTRDGVLGAMEHFFLSGAPVSPKKSTVDARREVWTKLFGSNQASTPLSTLTVINVKLPLLALSLRRQLHESVFDMIHLTLKDSELGAVLRPPRRNTLSISIASLRATGRESLASASFPLFLVNPSGPSTQDSPPMAIFFLLDLAPESEVPLAARVLLAVQPVFLFYHPRMLAEVGETFGRSQLAVSVLDELFLERVNDLSVEAQHGLKSFLAARLAVDCSLTFMAVTFLLAPQEDFGLPGELVVLELRPVALKTSTVTSGVSESDRISLAPVALKIFILDDSLRSLSLVGKLPVPQQAVLQFLLDSSMEFHHSNDDTEPLSCTIRLNEFRISLKPSDLSLISTLIQKRMRHSETASEPVDRSAPKVPSSFLPLPVSARNQPSFFLLIVTLKVGPTLVVLRPENEASAINIEIGPVSATCQASEVMVALDLALASLRLSDMSSSSSIIRLPRGATTTIQWPTNFEHPLVVSSTVDVLEISFYRDVAVRLFDIVIPAIWLMNSHALPASDVSNLQNVQLSVNLQKVDMSLFAVATKFLAVGVNSFSFRAERLFPLEATISAQRFDLNWCSTKHLWLAVLAHLAFDGCLTMPQPTHTILGLDFSSFTLNYEQAIFDEVFIYFGQLQSFISGRYPQISFNSGSPPISSIEEALTTVLDLRLGFRGSQVDFQGDSSIWSLSFTDGAITIRESRNSSTGLISKVNIQLRNLRLSDAASSAHSLLILPEFSFGVDTLTHRPVPVSIHLTAHTALLYGPISDVVSLFTALKRNFGNSSYRDFGHLGVDFFPPNSIGAYLPLPLATHFHLDMTEIEAVFLLSDNLRLVAVLGLHLNLIDELQDQQQLALEFPRVLIQAVDRGIITPIILMEEVRYSQTLSPERALDIKVLLGLVEVTAFPEVVLGSVKAVVPRLPLLIEAGAALASHFAPAHQLPKPDRLLVQFSVDLLLVTVADSLVRPGSARVEVRTVEVMLEQRPHESSPIQNLSLSCLLQGLRVGKSSQVLLLQECQLNAAARLGEAEPELSASVSRLSAQGALDDLLLLSLVADSWKQAAIHFPRSPPAQPVPFRLALAVAGVDLSLCTKVHAPLLQVRTGPIAAAGEPAPGQPLPVVRVSCSALRLDYFNLDLMAWEPCVEPWDCTLTLTPQLEFLSFVLHSSAHQPLNVTLSPPLVRTLQTLFADQVARVLGDALPGRDLAAFPLQISNETEVVLEYTLSGPRLRRRLTFSLAPGETHPHTSDHPLLDLSADLEARLISSFPLTIQGAVVRVAQPSEALILAPLSLLGGTQVQQDDLVAELIQHQSGRLVRLRSRMRILNMTDLTLELRLGPRLAVLSHPPTPCLALLSPGAEFCVPLGLADPLLLGLEVRPSASPSCEWATWSTSLGVLGVGGLLPWRLHAHLEYLSTPASLLDLRLVLQAPLVLENALAARLEVVTPRCTWVVPSGGVLHAVTGADLDPTTQVMFRVGGYAPSERLSLGTLQHGARLVPLADVHDGRCHALTLSVETEHGAWGSHRRVRVRAPYWLVNHSLLPLEYGAPGVATVRRLAALNKASFGEAGLPLTYAAAPRLHLRLAGEDAWSPELLLVEGALVELRGGDWAHTFALQLEPGTGAYAGVYLVHVWPALVLTHDAPAPLLLRFPGASGPPLLLPPHSYFPLRWPALLAPPTRCFQFALPPQSEGGAEHETEEQDPPLQLIAPSPWTHHSLPVDWSPPLGLELFQRGTSLRVGSRELRLSASPSGAALHLVVAPLTPHRLVPALSPTPTLDWLVLVRLGKVSVSVVDGRPRELCYLWMQGVDLEAGRRGTEERVQAMVKHVQLDNQILGTPHPVVLRPVRAHEPALNLILERSVSEVGRHHVRRVVAQFNAFDVRVDEVFFSGLLSLWDDLALVIGLSTAGEARWRTQQVAPLALEGARRRSSPVQVDEVALGELKFYLSLSTVPDAEGLAPDGGKLKAFLRRQDLFLDVTAQSLVDYVARIDRAAITLPPVTALHLEQRLEDLLLVLGRQYAQNWRLSWITQLLAHSEASLLGMVSRVSLGLAAFPLSGARASGTSGAAKGLMVGTAKLLEQTISGGALLFQGLATSAQRVTALLPSETPSSSHQPAPLHVGAGVVQGVVALGSEVWTGVSGLVTGPVRGARAGGALGAVKGLGKGLVGAVRHPLDGVLALVRTTSQGVANTGRYLTLGPARQRDRLPRHLDADGHWAAYSEAAAAGQHLMRTLGGEAALDHYLRHTLYLEQGTPPRVLGLLVGRHRIYWLQAAPGSVELRQAWARVQLPEEADEEVEEEEERDGTVSVRFFDAALRPTRLLLPRHPLRIIRPYLRHLLVAPPPSRPPTREVTSKRGPLWLHQDGDTHRLWGLAQRGSLQLFAHLGDESSPHLVLSLAGSLLAGHVEAAFVPGVREEEALWALVLPEAEGREENGTLHLEAPSPEERSLWLHALLSQGATGLDMPPNWDRHLVCSLAMADGALALAPPGPPSALPGPATSRRPLNLVRPGAPETRVVMHWVDPLTVQVGVGGQLLVALASGDVFALPYSGAGRGPETLWRLSKPSPGRLRLRSYWGHFLAVDNYRVTTTAAPGEGTLWSSTEFPRAVWLHLGGGSYLGSSGQRPVLSPPPLVASHQWQLQRVQVGHLMLRSAGGWLAEVGGGLSLVPAPEPGAIFHLVRDEDGNQALRCPSGHYLGAREGLLALLQTPSPLELIAD